MCNDWTDVIIICITIFVLRYTPALRQLRQHALVLNFPSQCPSRLATRLLEVMFYYCCYFIDVRYTHVLGH